MASLAFHGLAYAAERIPDKIFHKVPGGYFAPPAEEQKSDKKSNRSSRRDDDDRRSRRHRRSRSRSSSRDSSRSRDDDRYYHSDDARRSSRDRASRQSDSEGEDRRRHRRHHHRRATEGDENRPSGPLDSAEKGIYQGRRASNPSTGNQAQDSNVYRPYNPADYAGIPADGRTDPLFFPPPQTASNSHDSPMSPVSPTNEGGFRPSSTNSDPLHYVQPAVDPLFPDRPRSMSIDPVFPPHPMAYGAAPNRMYSPVVNGSPAHPAVPIAMPVAMPVAMPIAMPGSPAHASNPRQQYSPMSAAYPPPQNYAVPSPTGYASPVQAGYSPQAPSSPQLAYGGNNPSPHQGPAAHPAQVYPAGIYNPALAAAYMQQRDQFRRSSLRHQVNSRSPSRSPSRARSEGAHRRRYSSRDRSPSPRGKKERASSLRRDRSSSRGRTNSKDSKQDASSAKTEPEKKPSLRERSRSRAREAQKRLVDHKVHGAHVWGALAGGIAGTAAGPLGTLAGLAAGGFGAHAIEKKRRQSIAKRGEHLLISSGKTA